MKNHNLKCPECGSNKIRFDAHAGFASCHNCYATSEEEGPGYFRQPLVDKQTKQ